MLPAATGERSIAPRTGPMDGTTDHSLERDRCPRPDDQIPGHHVVEKQLHPGGDGQGVNHHALERKVGFQAQVADKLSQALRS